MKHAFMQIFLRGHFIFMDLYVTVMKTFHELELRYLLYPRCGKYGKKRIKFLIHTIGGPKSDRQKVSVWTDSSAFLPCHVTEANCHASRQTNVPPFMKFRDCTVHRSIVARKVFKGNPSTNFDFIAFFFFFLTNYR